MIRIEDIKEIPEVMWNETSSKEFGMMSEQARKYLVDHSSMIKIFYKNDTPLLVGGVYQSSFLAIPYFWALLSEDFYKVTPSTLRVLVKAANTLIPRAETLVEENNEAALRLARLFKFEPSDTVAVAGDKEYRMFRRNSWLF